MALAGIEKQRGIAHGARDHIADAGAKPALEMRRPARRAITAGLEPHQTAIRGRNADRAATVGGMGHRHDPGGHGRCCAARGTTRAHGQVPRVARLPPQHGFRGGGQAELGTGRLAEGHGASSLVTADQGAGPGRWRGVLEQPATIAGRGAFQVGIEVFDQHRHAGQCPLGLSTGGTALG
ncbi:hypothetical protein PS685_05002 [Pseudomonas fluorescens]|uniref:Uncharacterized protein n=1 Tax=Pseudomonas fluorescens TaxID=294 RepID=A0A5E7A3H2_PSEFL|nr:hypothetical protein PS685_05002 [Pseudomonas fluorescens]